MPTSNDMEIISDQLDLLVNYHALAETERKKILDELNSLKKQPDKFKEYTESLSKGLPGVTKGVIGAIDAGKSGDPYAISIAAVDIFASVLDIAGPLLGPLGGLASALAGMVSTILGQFLAKPPSLKEQLTELLDKFLAEEKLRNLGAALDQIWVLSDTIQHHNRNYKPLNLQHGTEIRAIDDAWQWINQKDKQSVPEWDQVLEKTCMVWIQLLRCVTLSLAKPSTREGVAKDEMLVYLPARQERFLEYLRSIKPVVQQRGLYVHLGFRENGFVVYTAPGRAGDLKWSYKGNTQWMRNISIVVPRGQLGSPTPRYDLYACAEEPMAIVRHQLDSVKGDLSDGRQLLVYDKKYPYRGGGERWFGDCVSVCALADPNDAKATKVYAVNHPASNHNYVSLYFVDSNNKVETAHWEPGLNAEPQHIRAVASDVTKSLPDDPDVAGLPPHGLYEIIYAAYRGNRNIWVAIDNSFADLPGPENWSAYSGIEVDPYCLWIFGVDGIACATHASVVQCKNGKLKSPRWIYHDFDKSLWKEGHRLRRDFVPAICFLEKLEDSVLERRIANGMLRNEPRRDHAILADQASSGPAVLFNDCFQALRIAPVRFLHAGMVAVVSRRILDCLGANTQVFFAHRQQFATEIFVEHHAHSLFKRTQLVKHRYFHQQRARVPGFTRKLVQ